MFASDINSLPITRFMRSKRREENRDARLKIWSRIEYSRPAYIAPTMDNNGASVLERMISH
jgi:hypothetical protein